MHSRMALVMVALTSVGASAQRFDVASVRRNTSGDQGQRTLNLVPGGVRVINLPLSTILWMAHGVQQVQMFNVPSWATSESFDITAKAPEGTRVSLDTFRPMLVELLADRFHLKTHHEMRELPVYRLVRVRETALGPKMNPAAVDCAGRSPAAAGAEARAQATNCGATGRPGGISVHGMPLATLTRLLGPAVGRVVVDETGLTGNWDLDVDYTPEQIQGNAFPAGAPPAGSASTDAPSLFTALQEQLGLKLEAGRAAVDVIVIDNLARPTED